MIEQSTVFVLLDVWVELSTVSFRGEVYRRNSARPLTCFREGKGGGVAWSDGVVGYLTQ